MKADDVIRGQAYVDLGPQRRPLGFYIGGLHRPAQIPDDATPISRELHRQWGGDTSGQVLSANGLELEPAPVPVVSLGNYKAAALGRIERAGEIRGRNDTLRRTDRQARVWAATVAQARAADSAGSIVAGQHPFVDAFYAGSLAINLGAAVTQILAISAEEENAEAATELIVQTALAVVVDAVNEAEVDAVFPIFPPS